MRLVCLGLGGITLVWGGSGNKKLMTQMMVIRIRFLASWQSQLYVVWFGTWNVMRGTLVMLGNHIQ